MKTTFNRLGAALVAAAFCTAPSLAFADGKSIFVDNKCTKCHEVSTQGIAAKADADDKEEGGKKPVDLAGSGKDHEVGWYAGWLKKETEMDSKLKPGAKIKHKAKWKGNDADLATLSAWLKSLTEKKK